jgi:hypothetical protein
MVNGDSEQAMRSDKSEWQMNDKTIRRSRAAAAAAQHWSLMKG